MGSTNIKKTIIIFKLQISIGNINSTNKSTSINTLELNFKPKEVLIRKKNYVQFIYLGLLTIIALLIFE